jgi:hypothetical protein
MGRTTVNADLFCHCGRVLDEPPGLPVDQRKPCPECGSLGRLHKVEIHEELKLEGHLGMRSRHPGKGKWKVQQHEGDSFFHKTGVWHRVSRLLDRVNDLYRERVIDEHGEVIRDSEEPLSKHIDHGSAKRRSEKK